jgi:hypothetical protein
MVFKRESIFILLAFVLFLFAALVGGGLITSSDLSVSWLIPGGLASYMLALLV